MNRLSVRQAAAVAATALAAACPHAVHAEAQHDATSYRITLAPADPAITSYSAGDGTYRLMLDMRSFAGLAGRLELRHSQYFVDDNLKGVKSRNSVFWSLRWRF